MQKTVRASYTADKSFKQTFSWCWGGDWVARPPSVEAPGAVVVGDGRRPSAPDAGRARPGSSRFSNHSQPIELMSAFRLAIR
jgi:hypothetical protein